MGRAVRTCAAAFAVALAMPGCTGSKQAAAESRALQVQASTAALAARADVREVWLRISGPGGFTAESTLTAAAGDGSWSALFQPVPAGTYAITARAENAAGDPIYETASPVAATVSANGVATVTIVLQQVDPPSPVAIVLRCPAGSSPVPMKILALNDFHGQISAGQKIGSSNVGSAAVVAAYLKTAMAGKEDRTVVVEAGDLVCASPASSALLQDEPSIDFMNAFANASCPAMPPPARQSQGADRFDALLDPACNVRATRSLRTISSRAAATASPPSREGRISRPGQSTSTRSSPG